MARIRLVTLVVLSVFVGGCSNLWRDGFSGNPALRGVEFERTGRVRVRTVEPERLGAYLEASRERALGRDLAPDEWPEEWQFEEKQEFLKTLRITEEPRGVFFLGTSAFTNPGTLNINGRKLDDFARQIGADYAVVAEHYVGLRDKIEYTPITTINRGGWGGGWGGWGGYGRHGDRRYWSDFSFSTTYVPAVVAVDTYHYIAYFLRSTTPEEFDRIRSAIWAE